MSTYTGVTNFLKQTGFLAHRVQVADLVVPDTELAPIQFWSYLLVVLKRKTSAKIAVRKLQHLHPCDVARPKMYNVYFVTDRKRRKCQLTQMLT